MGSEQECGARHPSGEYVCNRPADHAGCPDPEWHADSEIIEGGYLKGMRRAHEWRVQLIEEHEVPYFIPARAINRKQLLAEPDDAR